MKGWRGAPNFCCLLAVFWMFFLFFLWVFTVCVFTQWHETAFTAAYGFYCSAYGNASINFPFVPLTSATWRRVGFDRRLIVPNWLKPITNHPCLHTVQCHNDVNGFIFDLWPTCRGQTSTSNGALHRRWWLWQSAHRGWEWSWDEYKRLL